MYIHLIYSSIHGCAYIFLSVLSPLWLHYRIGKRITAQHVSKFYAFLKVVCFVLFCLVEKKLMCLKHNRLGWTWCAKDRWEAASKTSGWWVIKSFAHWGKSHRETMHIGSNWRLNVWQLQKSWRESEIPSKPLNVHMLDNSRWNSAFALKSMSDNPKRNSER